MNTMDNVVNSFMAPLILPMRSAYADAVYRQRGVVYQPGYDAFADTCGRLFYADELSRYDVWFCHVAGLCCLFVLILLQK